MRPAVLAVQRTEPGLGSYRLAEAKGQDQTFQRFVLVVRGVTETKLSREWSDGLVVFHGMGSSLHPAMSRYSQYR